MGSIDVSICQTLGQPDNMQVIDTEIWIRAVKSNLLEVWEINYQELMEKEVYLQS
jgi:hypothetical protein